MSIYITLSKVLIIFLCTKRIVYIHLDDVILTHFTPHQRDCLCNKPSVVFWIRLLWLFFSFPLNQSYYPVRVYIVERGEYGFVNFYHQHLHHQPPWKAVV